jgi:hypothetical protein
MLNLAFVFDDAVRALTRYSDRLQIAALPAAVYLMQVDVINHYQYALDHYLTVPLDSPFLQNSSFGTPYQKWAHFTNEDFELLSFSVHNLLRYTSRLIHESECIGLRESGRFDEMRALSNAYTATICDMRYEGKAFGVTVHPNSRMTITPARTGQCSERLICRSTARGSSELFRIIRDSDGTERELPIRLDEYERPTKPIQSESIDILDRARLLSLQERWHAEVAVLRAHNHAFKQTSDVFFRSRSVTESFENLNESYWI